MRILIAHSKYRWSGGEETTVRNQALALRGAGHTVEEYVAENPSDTVATLASLAVAPFNPVEYRSVRRAIRRFRPDVVHVHNTWFRLSPAVFYAAGAEGVPSVWTIQNYRLACPQGQFVRDGSPCTDCLGRAPLPGVRYGCYRGSRFLTGWNGITTQLNLRIGFLDEVARFVVPSDFARSLLVNSGLPAKRTVTVYNAVPDPGVRPTAPSASSEVLLVGRLSEEKGFAELVDVWNSVRPSDLRLRIVGAGPLDRELRRRAGPGVVFEGLVPPSELHDLMRKARCLVFPSIWYEVCPLVILEAYAAGLPVFGRNLGAIAELLSGVDERCLVADSEGGWSELLQTTIQHDVLIDELSKASRDRFGTTHRLGVQAGILTHLYDAVVVGSPHDRGNPEEL